MKHLQAILIAVLVFLFSGCAATSDGVDLGNLARQIELVRMDISDLAPLAQPETQERLERLNKAIVKVEDALRAADQGGPVSSVGAAARAALEVADQVIQEMQASGAYVGDWPLYLGVAKIALRHISAGDPSSASEELATIPESK